MSTIFVLPDGRSLLQTCATPNNFHNQPAAQNPKPLSQSDHFAETLNSFCQAGGGKTAVLTHQLFSQRTNWPVNRPQLCAASSKRQPDLQIPEINEEVNGRFPPESTLRENSKKAHGRFSSKPFATFQNLAKSAPREPGSILAKNYDQKPAKMTG
ncbi:MAG: hypothetical protein IPM39_00025 [Chloroflexi bacterium]|nr:hypothetical protein [Chloroflexota bacterium]